jgi:hypothetical protein
METKNTNILALWSVIVLIILFLTPQDIFSQGPPPWAPAHGHRVKTKHVYFPEQNFYYDIEKRNYIYLRNGNWTVSMKVPSVFVGVNLKVAPRVELEIGGHTPYQYNKEHILKYKKPKKHNHKNGNPHKSHKHKK